MGKVKLSGNKQNAWFIGIQIFAAVIFFVSICLYFGAASRPTSEIVYLGIILIASILLGLGRKLFRQKIIYKTKGPFTISIVSKEFRSKQNARGRYILLFSIVVAILWTILDARK